MNTAMKLYAIRRNNAWADEADLEAAGARSSRVGNEEMPNDVRWIRTYVVREPDGSLGSVCIYEGVDVEAIREHARRSGFGADEIAPVETTIVVRADPEPAERAA